MKKNLSFLLVLLSGMFVACSSDNDSLVSEESNQEDITMSNTTMSQNFVLRTDTIHLFEAHVLDDIDNNINLLSQFDREIESVVEDYHLNKKSEDPEVDKVSYKLNFKNKKAYITDLVFWNTDLEIALPIIPYIGQPVYDFDEIFDCPDGWSGGQSYGSQDSINQASNNIMSKAFLQGDCVEIRYVKGIFTVKLCHRKC